jgi:hypothetical protein
MRKPAAAARWLGCLAALLIASAWAAAPSIYSCTDAKGNKLTSDRPIPECANLDQRVLNPDGSVRKIVPPTPTADEHAAIEAAERRAAAERGAQQEAVRRDRNLVTRFPNEAAHQHAREVALEDVRAAVRSSEDRLKQLAAERKPLTDEAEFYAGKPLPAKLKQALDANDATVEAQRALVQNQQAEIVRINNRFDIELDRLKRLWAGAPPGSMGPLATQAALAPAPRASNPTKSR